MPDAHGNFKGIAIPAAAWDRIFGQGWRCGCGESDIAKRYGGPADHEDCRSAPCESCVMVSFAEHG